jgi:hypothetical protein
VHGGRGHRQLLIRQRTINPPHTQAVVCGDGDGDDDGDGEIMAMITMMIVMVIE